VLKKVCDVVASHMRRADYFFRIGGEEFVILALHTGADGGHNLAEKMRESIAGTHIGAIDGAVTVSFGLAELGAADDDETLFRRADAALYQAKHLGRNRVVMAGTEN
jgi:diguanylate cyclase